MEQEGVGRLPRPSDLSPSLIHFLNDQFRTRDDLSRFPNVELELRRRCSHLETALSGLTCRLSESFAVYAAHSNDIGAVVGGVREVLFDLRSCEGVSPRDGEEGEETERSQQILGKELPALARGVARVETVRAYAGFLHVTNKPFLFCYNLNPAFAMILNHFYGIRIMYDQRMKETWIMWKCGSTNFFVFLNQKAIP